MREYSYLQFCHISAEPRDCNWDSDILPDRLGDIWRNNDTQYTSPSTYSAEFLALPFGLYTVRASKGGFQTSSTTASIGAASQSLVIRLDQTAGFSISGRVIRETDGAGLEGRDVFLDGVPITVTDYAGDYYIPDVAPGTHGLTASAGANEYADFYNVILTDASLAFQDIYIYETSTQGCIQAYGANAHFCLQGIETCTGSGGLNGQITNDAPEGTFCCSVPCEIIQNDARDSDGDGALDIDEDCDFEPEKQYRTPGVTRETDVVGGCTNGIDDDCDSTQYVNIAGVDTNREDNFQTVKANAPSISDALALSLTDPDCTFCPVNKCDISTNQICSEADLAWYTYDLADDAEKAEYCGICPGDNDCKNQCEQQGYSCCASGDASASYFPEYDADCTGDDPTRPECWSKCAPIATGTCCEYTWLCNGVPTEDRATCGDLKPYRCDQPTCQNFPQCRIREDYSSNRNIYTVDNPEITDGYLQNANEYCLCSGTKIQTNAHVDGAPIGRCCPAGPNSDPESCPAPTMVDVSIQVFNGTFIAGSPTPLEPGQNLRVYWAAGPWVSCKITTGVSNSCLLSSSSDPKEYFRAGEPQTFIVEKWVDGDLSGEGLAGFEINISTANLPSPSDPGFSDPYFHRVLLSSRQGCEIAHTPVDTLEVWNVQGELKVRLDWTNPCVGKIAQFEFERRDITHGGFVSFTVPGDQEEYFDTYNLQWQTEYEYHVKARYIVDGEASADYFGTYVHPTGSLAGKTRVNTGDLICEGRTQHPQFCINENMNGFDGDLLIGVHCYPNNMLSLPDRDCRDVAPPGPYTKRCFIDPSGNADCRPLNTCKDPELQQGWPFGLYYDRDVCLDDTQGQCYFDYSNTTVDVCTNCVQPDSDKVIRGQECFDYRSEDACTVDNCQLDQRTQPWNTDCKWYPYVGLEEFGKGVCFKQNYSRETGSTLFCSKCSLEENAPFDNPVCTQNVCSRLGSCYAADQNNIDYGQCAECTPATTCEDMVDKLSCIGGVEGINGEQEFDINNEIGCASGTKFTPSNDACNIGRCKWGPVEVSPGMTRDVCFRDANDDEVNDCTPLTDGDGNIVGWENQCQQDKIPPDTSLDIDTTPSCESPVADVGVIPNCLNAEDQLMRFNIYEAEWTHEPEPDTGTYYCLTDGSTSACPRHKVYDENLIDDFAEVTLPADYPETVPQGHVNLTFYGVDEYHNYEAIKTHQMYVDSVRPAVTINPYARNDNPDDPFTSDVTFVVTSSELAVCSEDELRPGQAGNNGITNPGLDMVFNTEFTDLPDRFYLYTVNCTDAFGNKHTESVSFLINRLGYILDQAPDVDLVSSERERLDNVFNRGIVSLNLT